MVTTLTAIFGKEYDFGFVDHSAKEYVRGKHHNKFNRGTLVAAKARDQRYACSRIDETRLEIYRGI